MQRHKLLFAAILMGLAAIDSASAMPPSTIGCTSEDGYQQPKAIYDACGLAIAALPAGNSAEEAELRAIRADAAYYAGRLDLAYGGANLALDVDARNKRAHLRRFWVLMRSGEEFKAMEDLRYLLLTDKDDAEVQNALGAAYTNSRDWEITALPAYRRALEINPRAHNARLNLARIYAVRMSRPDLALVECDNILKASREELAREPKWRDSESPLDFRGTVGEFRLQLIFGKLTKLRDQKELEAFAAEYPQSLKTQISLATIYRDQMNWQGMRVSAEKAYTISPGGDAQRALLLAAYWNLKLYREGIEAAAAMIDQPSTPSGTAVVYYFRAFFNKQLGQPDKALDDFETAFSLDSSSLRSALTQLIQAHYYSGNPGDDYTETVRNALQACIIDMGCGQL